MKVVLIPLLTLFLISCASTTSEPVSQEQLLRNVSEPLPQRPASFEEIFDTAATNARVILIDDHKYQRTKEQLKEQLTQAVNFRLGKLSGVVVKSELSQKLKNEISLAESSGKEIGRQDIDFVLYMGLSAYKSDEKSEKKEKLFSDGNYYECEVEAELDGWFRLVEIPSMRVIEQSEFNEDTSESKDLDGSNRCSRKVYDNLFIDAHKDITSNVACDAVEDMKSHLKSLGHVLGKEIFSNELVYETSLTSLQGLEKGDTVEFSHTKNGTSYAEGKVVKVTSINSLIKLVDMTESETIYTDDFIKAANNSSLGLSCLF